jgi:hypothetical protein
VRRAEKANIVDAIVAGVRAGGDELLEISPRNGTNNEEMATNERQWNNYFARPVQAFTQV